MTVPQGSGSGERHYKVRLDSGRVLGPLELDRVRLLILKGHIVGNEQARVYPEGEWQDINRIPELAQLLLLKAEGKLTDQVAPSSSSPKPSALQGSTAPTVHIQSETKTVKKERTHSLITAKDIPQDVPVADDILIDPEGEKKKEKSVSRPKEKEHVFDKGESVSLELDSERTQINEQPKVEENTRSSRTMVEPLVSPSQRSKVSDHETIMFSRPVGAASESARNEPSSGRRFRLLLMAGFAVILVSYWGDDSNRSAHTERRIVRLIRPELPSLARVKGEPEVSRKLYEAGIGAYLLDTIEGYKEAAAYLKKSVEYDPGNVKATAMLASAYLNLIDATNKDENYFIVINKLLELARGKSIDLAEAVIADAEYYLVVQKSDAALNRIVDYTKKYPQSIDYVMFYYLASVFYSKGNYEDAVRYLSQYPDSKAHSPRLFFLRGQLAEKLSGPDDAIKEYEKAVARWPGHAKSRLRIAEISSKMGRLGEAAPHVEALLQKPEHLSPQDVAKALYLGAKLSELSKNYIRALQLIELAVKIDRKNHEYLLEYYTLLVESGKNDPGLRPRARMYYFLSEGERMLAQGKNQEALVQFLQAREVDLNATAPLMKAGDAYALVNDYANALVSYKKAAALAKNDPTVWTKYIQLLIQTYEWKDATEAMARFRNTAEAASSIDKLAGDISFKQGQLSDALGFYKKAMSRESIDPDVYVAFAKTLSQIGDCKNAPFFFTLASRLDPSNLEATLGTARCLAQTDGIDAGLGHLREELQKLGGDRPDLLNGIAEMQLQKGESQLALRTIESILSNHADYAPSYLTKGFAELALDTGDRKWVDKALASFKSYSDRNISDPQGYMERFKVYVKLVQYDKALEELDRVFAIYPKYPSLRYQRGKLLGLMGNRKKAMAEIEEELKFNPNHVDALVELGKFLSEEGQTDESVKRLALAMQLAPDRAEPKAQAAWTNYLIKNYIGAIPLMRGAIAADSGNPLYWKRLGIILRDSGDVPGSAESFRRYLELSPDAADKTEIERYLQ